MKISKEELIYTFAEIIGVYEGTPTAQHYQDLWEALSNGTLEIEGYLNQNPKQTKDKK